MKLLGIKHAWVNPDQITHRLVRNPNYCNDHVSLNGWCRVPVEHAKHKQRFFGALERDVSLNGFRNPIIIYSLPEGLHLSFGCSRLRVAKRLNKLVPCIINDYTGEFAEEPDVTEDNWTLWFRDPPRRHRFKEDGFHYHYSCERNRRKTYDPNGMSWLDGHPDEDEIIDNEFPWIREGTEE